MIVPKYFEDFDHLHVNTMPNRAYYIPASRRFRCRPSGRIMAMTTISIRTSATRSRWIRRMCRMRTRAVRT